MTIYGIKYGKFKRQMSYLSTFLLLAVKVGSFSNIHSSGVILLEEPLITFSYFPQDIKDVLRAVKKTSSDAFHYKMDFFILFSFLPEI